MKTNGSKFEIVYFTILICFVTAVNWLEYGFCGILLQLAIMILTTAFILSYQTKGDAK